MTIHDAVLCLLGDTPGSNFLGGFKESVGLSLCKCRRCLVTKEDMSQKVGIVYLQLSSTSSCILYDCGCACMHAYVCDII